MSLIFQCDGSDAPGIAALRARLDNLMPADQNRFASMAAAPSVVRVWVGAGLPADARAWMVEAEGLPDGESVLARHPHLLLLARINAASGLAPEMHVVHERSHTPVSFQSRSELEGYFAERLASIQEVE